MRPDVGIVHAQRADREGNVQLWGIVGVQKEIVLASDPLAGHGRGDRRRAGAAAGRDRPADLGGRRGRRGAARRPSLLRPRLLRPRQRLLSALGRDQPGPRRLPEMDGGARAQLGGGRMTAEADSGRLGRRDDDRGRRPGAHRRDGLLRRDRPAEHRGQPGAAHARPAHRPGLRVGHDRIEAQDAAPLDRRRRAGRDGGRGRPGARRSSPTGCRAAGSTSASSARRRSTASATSTAP